MDIIRIETNKTNLISDGGCGYLEPDNSYNAFLASCNRCYYGIKCDIRFTKDREIVTSRYRDLRKLTNEKIHISLSNFLEIKDLPLKNDNHAYISTLKEFLILCKKYRKLACIELHPPIGYLEIEQLLQTINNEQMNKYCKIISNDVKYLKIIRQTNLDIQLELKCLSFIDQNFYDAIKYHFDLTFPFKKITSELIDLCHDNRIKIGCYNMNDPINAILLIDMKIDYLYTIYLESKK